MTLAQLFDGVAYKRLVASDLPKMRSNQHELTGVRTLRPLFGTNSKFRGRMIWVFFPTKGQPAQEENEFTFYDARAKGAQRTGRSEWKLYYYGTFLSRAQIGDLLVFANCRARGWLGLIFSKSSAAYAEAVSLFALDATTSLDRLSTELLETRVWDESQTPVLSGWFHASIPN